MAGIGKYLETNKKIGSTDPLGISPEREKEIKENMICSITNIPEEAIRLLKLVTYYGEHKHGKETYLDKDNFSMSKKQNEASINRHSSKAVAGIRYDDESGLPNRAMAAWRLLMAEVRLMRGIDVE